jgi:hypothetical protein
MTTEYVKFSAPEKIYGQKNMLRSELESLEVVKRIRNFKKLRKEDLVLRLALKKKIQESLENLKTLDKLLPHSKMAGLRKRKVQEDLEEDEENLTLEQEIEVIRRKLNSLQG